MNKLPDGSIAGRPLRADAERNRRRVLEVALEVFATEGLACPIDEIARRAGFGVGTLYRHFPTKETLIAAILTMRMADQTERIRQLIASGERGPDTLFDFLTEMVSGWQQKRDFIEALSRAGVDLEDIKRAKIEFHEALDDLLERSKADGHVRAGVSCHEILALLAAAFAPDRPDISAEGRKRMLDIIYDGLRPPRP